MLRMTRLIRDTLAGAPLRRFDGVILIWNLTRACNLRCKHCYAAAAKRAPSELTTDEVLEQIRHLPAAGVRFVILSGGEPLIRKDVFEIAAALREAGIVPYLSTNGTLLTDDMIPRIREHFPYIGISIDGDPETHDAFRGMQGAYWRSLEALRRCRDAGIRTGLRFTLSPQTARGLGHVLDLVEFEDIPKVYVSHLVDAGRGGDLAANDRRVVRAAVAHLIDTAFRWAADPDGRELVTGNNEADAPALLREMRRRHPTRADDLLRRLRAWGGNQAGVRLANIGWRGDVRPDPFWPEPVGSVRQAPFDRVWAGNGALGLLRETPRRLTGRCGDCEHIDICNGGSRPRAFAAHGRWDAEDPACHL